MESFVPVRLRTPRSSPTMQDGVTVPNNAIVTFAGIEKVIVVQNGKALEKPITTGRRNADFTRLLPESVSGEKSCRSGQPAIRQPVEVVD
jgi:hypothetical protein